MRFLIKDYYIDLGRLGYKDLRFCEVVLPLALLAIEFNTIAAFTLITLKKLGICLMIWKLDDQLTISAA